jgi:uncharacterized protein (DUF885 family)
VFDLMPRDDDEDWEVIATRLEKVPASLRGLRSSLEVAVARGLLPARRQALACAAQSAAWAGLSGTGPFFASLADRYTGSDEALRRRLASASDLAGAAYAVTSQWLRDVLAPAAPERDAVGRDRYELAARQHLGAGIDPLEEAMIAPSGGAAAQYYTGPSEDFSRPARTWYPTLGRSVFPIWGEVSTCYHEAVPGHHLQVGQIRYLKDRLIRFQRHVFNTGHGEGWALYAERLMDELGYFANPEQRLGFLHSQLLRALRVVVDIGIHLELTIPAGDSFHPGERWTPELGLEFLLSRGRHGADFLRSELDRYLGWPGQAICYKVGERRWLEARAEARRRQGAGFDLKRFHTGALALGPLTLGQLVGEVATAA